MMEQSEQFYTPGRFAALGQSAARARFAFQCYIGAFVIVSAFLFGLSNGLSRQLPRAYASVTPAESFARMGMRFGAPAIVPFSVPGITPIPVGQDITINGKPGSVMMFTTDRGVKEVVNAQIALWRDQGLTAAGISSSDRGSALAFSRESGDRYTITAWRTNGKPTALGALDAPVQGIISFLKSGVSLNSSQEEIGGEVPGVTPMPGAKPGSVFSSNDPGGRSFTSAYTNPVRMAEAIDYYRDALIAEGWRLVLDDHGGTVGSLRLIRGTEQITMLFNPLRATDNEGEKSLVTVTRSAREEVLDETMH